MRWFIDNIFSYYCLFRADHEITENQTCSLDRFYSFLLASRGCKHKPLHH